jgi:hypothetical protein
MLPAVPEMLFGVIEPEAGMLTQVLHSHGTGNTEISAHETILFI